MVANDPTLRARPTPALSQLPGIRAFRSASFRMVLAGTILAVVVTLLLMALARQAADPLGQYGIDFTVYQQAARDIATGSSPYAPGLLAGPVPAGEFGHKYSPAFAQLFIPLAWLPHQLGTSVWGLIQAALAVAAVWLAGTFGGARPSGERLLWSAVAAALFVPVWDSIWKGNVSAAQSFQVALMLSGGTLAGASLAGGVLFKTTPLALLPAALAAGGKILRGTILAGVGLTALSLLFAPRAWLDFLLIQPNLLLGAWSYPANIAPANLVALAAPDQPLLASITRVAAFGLGLAGVLGAMLAARRPAGWPAAVVMGTAAMLLIPGAAWYHYLAVLLPPAAFAWPRASDRQRGVLLMGGAGVVFGLAALPLATLGGAVLVLGTLHVVWPFSRSFVRMEPHATSARPADIGTAS